MKCFMSGKECDFKIVHKPLQVFVISPFGLPFDEHYHEGISRILSKIEYREITEDTTHGAKLEALRADQAPQLGFVMCQKICLKIQESEFIIADISKPNPNVFYELGLSYGMNKKIILIGQQKLEDAFTFGLGETEEVEDKERKEKKREKEKKEFYINYQTFDAFKIDKKDVFVRALKNPVSIQLNPTLDKPESNILNIINENSTIHELQQKTLTKSIHALEADPHFSLWNEWKVIPQPISVKTKIEEILDSMKNCKICAIDTSIYGKSESDINPYVFFCLGLGHGLQKEVVPLTYKSQENGQLPFDVRGLWHIFYKDLDQLKTQFMGIMPLIDENWRIEQKEYLFKKTWNPFLNAGKLHIMTYGRSKVEEQRGIRTNIDKWDYMSVSELAHFFALKFPKAQVTIAHPMSKLNNVDINELEIEKMKEKIFDKNCIIIGSPDVSDLAEIVLSKLHYIEPYQDKRQKFNGYVIIKKLRTKEKKAVGNVFASKIAVEKPIILRSSVYWQILKETKESEGIFRNNKEDAKTKHFDNKPDKNGNKEEIYGILTIANNPFVSNDKKRKIMILSGFSGIATYGIAKCLTDEEKCKEVLEKLDAEYDNQKINRDKNVQILIRTKFSIDHTKRDDNRDIEGVSFEEMIPI